MDSSSPVTPKRKIPIHVAANKAYIWSVDDVRTLRIEHHICGSLVGTLPSISQQNIFLGLPLSLMPEEVVVLVENGTSSDETLRTVLDASRLVPTRADAAFTSSLACPGVAVLIDDTQATRPPSTEEISAETATFIADIRAQQQELIRDDAERRANAHKIVLSEKDRIKRDARIKAKQEKAAANRAAALAAGEIVEGENDTAIVEEVASKPPPVAASVIAAYQVFTPPTSEGLPYYHPEDVTYETLEAAREAGVWTYPSTLEERSEAGVFRALWERGYFMGVGLKFGGKLLVYPGES